MASAPGPTAKPTLGVPTKTGGSGRGQKEWRDFQQRSRADKTRLASKSDALFLGRLVGQSGGRQWTSPVIDITQGLNHGGPNLAEPLSIFANNCPSSAEIRATPLGEFAPPRPNSGQHPSASGQHVLMACWIRPNSADVGPKSAGIRPSLVDDVPE